jgi:hypothetical protein
LFLGFVQIEDFILPYLSIKTKSYKCSLKYKKCIDYLPIQLLIELNLLEKDYSFQRSLPSASALSTIFKANQQQKELLIKLFSEKNDTNGFVVSSPKSFKEILHNESKDIEMINLLEFIMAYSTRPFYLKKLSFVDTTKDFVKNYKTLKSMKGGILAVLNGNNVDTTVPFLLYDEKAKRALNGLDIKIGSGIGDGYIVKASVIREFEVKYSLKKCESFNLKEEKETVDLITRHNEFMVEYLCHKVPSDRKNQRYYNVRQWLVDYPDKIKVLCLYDKTFPLEWLKNIVSFSNTLTNGDEPLVSTFNEKSSTNSDEQVQITQQPPPHQQQQQQQESALNLTIEASISPPPDDTNIINSKTKNRNSAKSIDTSIQMLQSNSTKVSLTSPTQKVIPKIELTSPRIEAVQNKVQEKTFKVCEIFNMGSNNINKTNKKIKKKINKVRRRGSVDDSLKPISKLKLGKLKRSLSDSCVYKIGYHKEACQYIKRIKKELDHADNIQPSLVDTINESENISIKRKSEIVDSDSVNDNLREDDTDYSYVTKKRKNKKVRRRVSTSNRRYSVSKKQPPAKKSKLNRTLSNLLYLNDEELYTNEHSNDSSDTNIKKKTMIEVKATTKQGDYDHLLKLYNCKECVVELTPDSTFVYSEENLMREIAKLKK